ncbi:hypothetical protein CHS0354_003390 [Potamilus streckersoni]|uniref:TGF-beta family profile domain-containing protein n=1 Tax=Potamilus streckersoni TaxID=2493646 RepID=A0AAE0W1U9_9BIVA|nr:hypothetical protein CHS0354_003390 [Potamilus streckersoni]
MCVDFDISKQFLYANVSKLRSTAESDQNLNENEVLSHLKMNGGVKTYFERPSTEFMLKLFRTLQHGKKLAEALGHKNGLNDRITVKSDTVRSFSGLGFTESQKESFTFQLPLLPIKEMTRKVEVRFQQERKQIFQNKPKVIIKQKDRLLHRVRYRGHSYNEDEYIVFDLTSTLYSLINDYHGNLTIEFKGKSGNLTRKTKFRREATTPYPILVLYSESGDLLKSVYGSFTSNDATSSNRRSKRADNRRRKKHKKSRWISNQTNGVRKKCQIHDFFVDFNLIGWGPWIIHPKKFNAHACFGTCPSPITYQYSPTNHAILQTLMRMQRPLSAPEACCVPTKLQPLSMLYFEYDEIVIRYHEDMVVTECGCR